MNRLPHARLAAQARLPTPLGTMTAAATAQGIAGLWFDGQAHHPGALDVPDDPRQRWLQALRAQLDAYFAQGTAGFAFDLPLDLAGTLLQRAVWQTLAAIPYGQRLSYGELARHVGRPTAVRAVAAAVARNPVSIVVPCHRVVGHDGALTGYAGGLERKRALLEREAPGTA
ncbi:methylated-DNA--[protein]-cysteine S-methyltransferase [Azohydromonas sp.]|uniref:methylated-DNA--[protein]-cysteine S-methyltransferase n=1 Tax=Azohydromonas sp. TaxID=1872666 RepID=UPI002C8FCA67|nr:methylated-DNA--[protein]-cysteine S-methyltransferase [Azohydromonas sp.]HMM86116.1 methylated-DNA--[protein]-cysteine S-methyltransferase [Azohydromonas sp.]